MNARTLFLLPVLAAAPALAQNESRLHRDFRVEGEALKVCTKFSFGNLTDCGQTLVMGQPVHLAIGSLPPQNGLGFGLAFVEHKNFASEWRANWDMDAVAASNGSWRAGGYMKAYRLPGGTLHMTFPGAHKSAGPPLFGSAPLFNFYSQSISLAHVDYYGLGQDTARTAHATFGFSENITGASAILPLGGGLSAAKMSLDLELNGRFPSLRQGPSGDQPFVQQLYTDANTPGLAKQTDYLQPGEGLRLEPAFFNGRLRLNYFGSFQQFVAPANPTYSFRRWNGDFTHTIPLYKSLPVPASQYNGPDDCTGPGGKPPAMPCPPVTATQELQGSLTLRAFLSESIADGVSRVPFYLMPTLGGSDMNGTRTLASYPDYRFRGPDLIYFQGALEHSIGKLPIGALFSAEGGKVALRRDDIGLNHFRHSFSAGFTVHAGGLPMLSFVYAWGGSEGSHPIATLSSTLMGSSSRPSLF
jgi:hypothetical protein